jgi:pyruvate,water dikinase
VGAGLKRFLASFLGLGLLLAVGCGGGGDGAVDAVDAAEAADAADTPEAPDTLDADTQGPGAVCDPADPDPLGPACALVVGDGGQFDRLSIGPTGVQHWERATKYMVPVTDAPGQIPPLVQNANRFPVHLDFLAHFFFPGLGAGAYAALVNERATRQYYAGNLVRIDDPAQGTLYGFTVYTSAKSSEQLEPVEVRRIYQQLATVLTAGPLVFTFEPFDALGPNKARAWIDPGFPIWFPLATQEVQAEVYTAGTAYGRVRRYTLEELDAALAGGLLDWRDIVVVDAVPFDLETVVSGLVTGGRQWELSHVNVRLARRGTPNLYIKDALATLAPWNGLLVRLDATNGEGNAADTWTVVEADDADAQAWWAAHRPSLGELPAVDPDFLDLPALTAMEVDDLPVPLGLRFGGKTTNLARLYAFLDAPYQVPGFGIPFGWFERFLDDNTITDQRGEAPEEVTLRQYIQRLASDPKVASDTLYRKTLLAGLRANIEDQATLPQGLTDALTARITQVFGAASVPVRFRSSSNVEDGLEFSGAGLYDSTTVCAADSTDGNTLGPSLCNPAQPKERTIERGLRRVWASLFSDRAWAERDWYQVPQGAASMAILVSLGFPDEAANGVAFTGDPAAPDDPRYLINSQLGDEKVVSNDPSKVPELVRLEITDGQVSHIARVRSSSLATPGVPVLDDDQLKELGALLAAIDAQYPLDLGTHSRDEVLLDLEFKVQKDSLQLKLKQIRPFLRTQTQE